MTNDDKVKLANEILEAESSSFDAFFACTPWEQGEVLQAIVSEWLQFTQVDPCRFSAFNEHCSKPYGHDGPHTVNVKHLL
jgi:hypothetical protein